MNHAPTEPRLEFWSRPLATLEVELGASPAGLASDEAAARLARVGPNALHPRAERALLLQFLSRFANPLVILLLGAATLSAFTGDRTSFVIITVMMLMSVTLDFVQELRAGRAAEGLKQSVALRVTALRAGEPVEIPAERLVPGDVVLLEPGALVPADGRVLECRDFS